jgi:outer membrane lipoprotein-sorting protein
MKLSIVALLPGVAGFALMGQASVAKGLFTTHANALKDAKSLQVTYTARQASSPSVEYKLAYSKPDMFRIDSPTGFVMTDGKTVWEYNKADNTYSEAPGGQEVLLARVQQDDVYAWSAFFLADPLKPLRNLNSGTKRVIKANAVTEVTFGIGESGKKTATLFLDNKLGIARGMTVRNETDGGPVELLVLATDIKLNVEPLPASEFTFVAPAGAKKAEKPKEAPATWATVATIFRRNCTGCHGSSNPKGGVDLSSYQSAIATGSIVAGDPDNSSAIQYIKGIRKPRMPRNAPPLPESEINAIAKWIKDGAKEN